MSLNADLIACPTCDALYTVSPGQSLSCARCHRPLITPEKRAGLFLVITTFLAVVLIYGAVTLPFLSIERFWFSSETTLVGVALTFEPPLLLLSLIVLALVLLLPALRLALTVYAFVPLVLDRAPAAGAATAFRWSETLRPWSMAEVFGLGCGVALFKITAMAQVTFGPAFYMFAALVVTLWVQDRLICRYGIWKALTP